MQVSVLGVLHYDVQLVLLNERVYILDDVRMAQLLHELHLLELPIVVHFVFLR